MRICVRKYISEHHNEAVWVQWIQFAKKQRSVSRSSSSRGSVLCLMLPTWLPPPPPPSSPVGMFWKSLWVWGETDPSLDTQPAWQWAATLLTSSEPATSLSRCKAEIYHNMSLSTWKLVIICLASVCILIYDINVHAEKRTTTCQCVCSTYLDNVCV